MGNRASAFDGKAAGRQTAAVPTIDYSDAAVPVRADLVTAHADLVDHLTGPGTWWTGAERSLIARCAREALACRFCAERKDALSPYAIDGHHDDTTGLDPMLVEVIHRVVTDPGRLSRRFYDDAVATSSLTPEHFVEAVAVAIFTTALDVFARSLDLAPAVLPDAAPGDPSERRPADVEADGAWVPRVRPGGADHDALYPGRAAVAEVEKALSLVPAEVEMLSAFARAHYMAFENVTRPQHTEPNRAIDRMQMEFVASRVSTYNDCFY